MPTKAAIFTSCVAIALLVGNVARADDPATTEAGAQFFEAKIRPVLVEQCYSCHSAGAKKLKAGLYLDTRAAVLKGGESGPAVVAGSPEKSRLIEALTYKNVDLQMPPKDKLADAQIADFAAWVKMGAPWGKQDAGAPAVAKAEAFDLQKRKAEHWAWHPVQPQSPPAVKNTAWARDPIDRFVLAGLEAKNLAPAAPADRRTLLRRLYFDLTGLPPAPADVESFVNDPAADAVEKVVDRLLASPRFGERWGRHWLDLVRYAETLGHEFDLTIPNAWRYRDYVIRATNDDVPYDQFVREHVAGDVLPSPRRAADGANESVVATGFYFLGEAVHSPVDVRQNQADNFDNRIDVLCKSFLGMTVACARCHDHKFDAISTADYYALYGYAKGARYTQAATNDRDIAARAAALAPAREKVRRAVAESWLNKVDALAGKDVAVAPAVALRAGDTDLAANRMEGWRADGAAFARPKPTDFVIGDDKRAVTSLAADALTHSGTISKKSEGAIRSPNFTLDKRYLLLRVEGVGARLSIVVDNFNVIRDPIYGRLKHVIKADKPGWVAVDLAMWQGHQAYLEFSEIALPDPGGPGSPPNSWLAIYNAILTNDPAAPPAIGKPAPVKVDQTLRQTIESWRDGTLTGSNDAALRTALLDAAIRQGLLDTPADPAVAAALKEYRAAEAAVPAPTYVVAAVDGQGGDENVFIRGNPKNLGPLVPRRFLEALSTGSPAASNSTSPRLALAERIADPANPLTARVYVNRVWHHLLGRGIVPSVDNFGKLGEPPSNPALLDHLADRFVKDGWSTKRLIRAVVLSSVYQQSSKSDEASDAADPDNKLCHRQNVRRLEAEAIRDNLLAVSGRLDPAMGGPSIPIHLTAFMEGRGHPGRSGPPDGAGRRSVYLEIRRNFLSPMLQAFDAPIPFNTMGRRSVSNVPAQALILMNDPFVLDQAKLWAKQLLSRDRGERDRIADMYQQAFSRPPTADEIAGVQSFLIQQADELKIDPAQRNNDPRVWTDLAHALMNTKEFIFLQ